MKKANLKLCSLMMAASMLLAGCNNAVSTDTSADEKESTASTSISTTESTYHTTDAIETTETTDMATETTTTTETTTATETESDLPVVDPTKYTDLELSQEALYDKMMGGWIGQMVGVAWTASTEFDVGGSILPANGFPTWKPEMIGNAYEQDDVYVEIPFLDAMKEHGAFCDPLYMSEKFADSLFNLWHANAAARKNLNAGFSWYDAGHYLINPHADDIDWQIECDFLGSMYPGLVNEAAERAFEIGHMIGYGDGVYGGVFVTAMHAAAYTARSIEEIVNAGVSVIPEGTEFRDVMDIVVKAYEDGKTWEEAWQLVETHCGKDDKCPEFNATSPKPSLNIDAKLNASYIAIGLLWGEGDFAKTVEISCRCGQDSDCNPSSAASILGNYYGASGIDEIYTSAIDYDTTLFDTTNYTLNDVVAINMDLTTEVLHAYGASEQNGTWTIKTNKSFEPVPYEQWADDFAADVIIQTLQNGAVKVIAGSTGTETLKSVVIDMGDGFTMYSGGYYHYAKTGTYNVKFTLLSDKGTTIQGEKTVEIEAIPSGKGITSAGDSALVYDGIIPYTGTPTAVQEQVEIKPASEGADVWAGIQFDGKFAINGLKFVEGKQNKKGGWFTETPTVEVLIDGEWVAVDATITPAYPGNSAEEQGNAFEQYRFTFKEIVCEGVRVIGKAGGSDPYISIGELIPRCDDIVTSKEFDNADSPIAISNLIVPTGSGSKDLLIICDGILDTKTYDTYNGKVFADVEFFGYQFREARTITKVIFTEGKHYSDGGWFKNGDIHIEALVNGEWKEVSASASPAYPNGDSQDAFGASYETYTFALTESLSCEGIRISGAAGGKDDFISINELIVQ